MAAVAMLGVATPASSACAPVKPGMAYPWQVKGHLPGDRWGTLNVDIDGAGKPLACRAIDTNMDREMIFWACRAVMSQERFDPIVKDGAPTAGTVTKTLLVTGHQHWRANEAARRSYFAAHPDERPGCYPS